MQPLTLPPMHSDATAPLPFSAEDAGDSLTRSDRAAVATLAPECRQEAAALLAWYRSHPDLYPAYVATVRELMRQRVAGGGFAPLHVANCLRHPLRGSGDAPLRIGNGEAVFLARVARLREPDLARAFDLRDAPLADAIIAAGWKP